MPLISFKKNRTPVSCEVGQNLMSTLLDNNIPVASSCGGDGVCAKCKVIVSSGNENLSAENETERFLKSSKKIPTNNRICCQVTILGDIEIDTTYW